MPTATIHDPLVRARRQEILELARSHGASRIRLFGSAVQGTAGPSSDLDFLIDLQPGFTLIDLGALQLDLQELLGRKVDLVEPAGLHWFIRDRVLAESIPL